MRDSKILRLTVLAALLTALGSSSAHAQAVQSLQLNHYRMAETGEDGFAVSRPDDRGHLRLGVRLDLDYNLNALVYETALGMASSERLSVVEHNLDLSANVSLGLFDRLVLWAGLAPVNFVQSGGNVAMESMGTYANADGAGIGDMRVGGRVRLFGERTEVFALALQLDVTLPLSTWANSNQRYTGERGATMHPELLGELRFGGGWRLTLNLGARFRLTDEGRLGPSGPTQLTVSHEFTWGAGFTIPFWVDEAAGQGLTGHIEVWGDNTFENFGDRESSPIEGLLGLRLEPARGWYIGLAGGTGISRGYGAPDFRGILSLAFADRAGVGPVDSDGDGIMDDVDECDNDPEDMDVWQDEDGCPEPDNDGDGILDGDDACPLEPEDIDGDSDTDGCPDGDTDGDGIPDSTDECDNDPEDRDTFEDENGCPDPDNDGDTVLDVDDGAPMVPEDHDGFADTDGIPDPDNDGDTVLDPNDECPLAPGTPEHNGCPQAIRLDVETGTIYILQRVEFATNRDVILDRSFPVLEEVRATLAANPQLLTIRIEGHTDDRGRDPANLDLSMRRARSVMHWLVEHGIEASRLEGWGCGETRPIEPNATVDGRQANRRVEFRVTSPAPASGTIPGMDGCIGVTEGSSAPAEGGGRRRRRGAD